jgi:hypothetical protein
MERRRFVSLAAAVCATGCIGGDGNESPGDTTPEPAEFGYSTWVPAAEYRGVGYVDLAAVRELTTLSVDGGQRTIVGDTSVAYTDIDAVITTSGGSEFEAYSGSFETSGTVGSVFPESETSDHAGYTVASGTVDGTEVEVAVSGSEAVLARGGASATDVIDAAVGDDPRQADDGDIIPGLSEYADEPLAVVFDFGVGNTAYQFYEDRDEGVAFVEVAVLPDEGAVQNTIEESYNYSDGRMEELNMSVRGEGRRLIIENIQSADSVEDTFFGSGGLLP